MRTFLLLAATLTLALPLGAQPRSVQRDSQAVADVASRYLAATMRHVMRRQRP